MHWFWGDERYVPPDHPRSNYRMAWDSLLSRVPIPAGNIHPVRTTHVTAERTALDYERTLQSFYGPELNPARPLFDVNLLGLGEDGHLASLFPNSEALAEQARWAISVPGPGPETRITLTYPALESSAHSAFLVTGAAKSRVLALLRSGDPALPASHFEPAGDLRIFADEAAVPELS
jgi:6-phosphogluconolactonase